MAHIDYYQRLTEVYTLDNTPLLVASAFSFAFGYLQYIYSIRISSREGKEPFPFWIHSFFLAHDSTWCYIFGSVAPHYNNHWFLRATSTGLLIWSALEIYCIHQAITVRRHESFASVFGRPNPTLGNVIVYVALLQAATYSIVFIGILLMGEGCAFQWFCLTNVVIAVGPIHNYLRRGSREGLSLGLCLVNIGAVIWTFTPLGMWVQALPEIFDQPVYYCAGLPLILYSLWAFYIVYSYPPKVASAKDPSPIW